MKAENLLTLGLVAVGGYFVYKTVTKLSDAGSVVAGALTNTGEAIGGKLYEWLNPYDPSTDKFYTVTFPDGQRHAIRYDLVVDSKFQWANVMYLMKRDAAGKPVAVRA